MESEEPKYKLGVALSGGGARGFAHAGALKAIEEAGLKPDVIAGVSAGSVVAVLYAAGVRPDDMLSVFEGAGITGLAQLSIGGGGLMKMDRFRRRVMRAIAPRKTFEELDIPVYIGATDLDLGEVEVFSSGTIADRMTASCSVPIIFKPVRINGRDYVDGGVLQNMPSRFIRHKCQRLIGINVSPAVPFTRNGSILDVAMRTYNLLSKVSQRADLEVCDVNVEMREIASYQMFNLKNIQKVFNAGYFNTRHTLREAGLWHPSSTQK